MDSGGGDSPASGQKELSISLAASSMIDASDMINQEAYKANLNRIQEVKAMARMLEMNNEVAHKNFLVDQLKKRVEDGRDAEDMLVRMRNQPGLPGTVQFTNDVPSDRSEVILPTTATVVEVPESHSYPPYSSPAPTTTSHPPQTMQQDRPTMYNRSLPLQAHQPQSFTPDVFRYYRPRQHSAAPHYQTPVDPGQMGYTTQNMPPQSRLHNPLAHQTSFRVTQVQQPSCYSQVTALPLADTLPIPGYSASTAGWTKTGPPHRGPSTSSSISTYCEPGFPAAQSTAFRPPVTTYNQPQNLVSLPSTFQVQVPLQGVPAGQVKAPSSHPAPAQSHLKPAEYRSQSVSTAVSKQVAISELQPPQKLPQQLQHRPQQLQPQLQRLLQPPLEPQQHSQQPPSQPQPLPQHPLQPQQQPRQSQALPSSERSLQPPQSHSKILPQSTDCIPSTSVSQLQNHPSRQSPQPIIAQEQAWQRGLQLRVDQATFIKAFQTVVQSGASQLKAFWHQAKTSGVSNEWFNAAIDSLPPGVWQSVVAQVNQSESTPDVPPLESVPQLQVTTHLSADVPVIGVPPPPTAMSTLQAAPGTCDEGTIIHPASRQISELYAAQLRYYAERAVQSTLPAMQVPSISPTPPANIAMTQTTVPIPNWNVPLVQTNVRTPKDVNRSTLARDILRSLGKIVPEPHQETGGAPTERDNNYEGDRLREITPSQPAFHVTSARAPAIPPATSIAAANTPSIPPARPNAQDQSQHVASPSPPTAKSVLQEAHKQTAVIEGPITIDLTLEDSDDSIDGKRQVPTSPIQAAASAVASSQPVSSTSTTNHTPLLENLSLEEPPVNVAAGSDIADADMHTPPLSLAAKESMDFKILYPPLASSEPGSPSLKQLPLFLPSPPVSPVHTEPPETDAEMVHAGENRSSLKRRSVDVDMIEIDTGLATPHARKRRRQQVYVLIPPAPLHVKKAILKMKERAMAKGIDSDLEGVEEDEEPKYSYVERLLIEESKLRLLERRCWWLNCSAILNCAANLLAHLRNHVREEDSQAPLLCRWGSCQRQFNAEQERDAHLERHTIRPLPCPFSGCDEQFDKPVKVMQHQAQHQKADRRELLIPRPTCEPIVPTIPARLGAPPQGLPSHRVIPRRVVKCRISAERHATVGPWVLWNIFSPIDLNMRKQNASMRCRSTRQSINYETDSSDPRRDDYDFLLALSYPEKNLQLDDLDSNLVTMSAARGLTLWGSGSATPGEYTNAVSVSLAMDAAAPSSVTEETRDKSDVSTARGNGELEEPQPGASMAAGEEDGMGRMLAYD